MDKPITKEQLKVLEKTLDALFSKLGINVEFSKHFFDRVNDPRNKQQITIPELLKVYKSLYSKHGQQLAKEDDIEEVIKSVSTDINIPVAIEYNFRTKEIELINKTVMRKKNFTTPNKVLKVESFKTFIENEQLEEALITFGGKAYPKFNQVVILSGGAGCFAGDTLVKTNFEYKPIKDIVEGDIVATYNIQTNKTEYKPVIGTTQYETHTSPITKLIFNSGKSVTCTESHLFYVDGTWKEAGDLVLNKDINLKSSCRVESCIVYDIEVEDNHNFYVTEDDILVHNSGKGFVKSNLLGIEGWTFDVDKLKELAIMSNRFAQEVKSVTGHDLKTFDLKKPENVSKIHDILGGMYKIDKKYASTTYKSILAADSDRKPNLIFDVTGKDIAKYDEIVRNVTQIGYDIENIHGVWVLNDIHIAIKQNQERSRTVPEDILISTHEGAAFTIKKLIDMGDKMNKYVGGDFYIVFNKAKVDSEYVQSSNVQSKRVITPLGKKPQDLQPTKGAYIKTANYFKLKSKGKAPISTAQMSDEMLAKIQSYIPDTIDFDRH